MMQNVNKVLVSNIDLKTSYAGTEVLSSETDIPVGEIFLENEKGQLIVADGGVTAAKAIRIGIKTAETLTVDSYLGATVAEATPNVCIYTPFIQKGKVTKATFTEYVAPVEDKITFDFSSASVVITPGNRYVVRFIYRDLYEHPGQFTKTYEVIALTNSVNDLIQALAARINKDMGRRITVATTLVDGTTSSTSAAVKLIATAKAKTDNEGKESINPYTQVSMTAVVYYTNPSATGFASKIKYPIANVVNTKVQGTAPKGYWKQVRDAEQAALAYKGITYRTSWPYSLLKPAIVADSAITYDSYIIEFENRYLTPDNQHNQTTRQTVELHFKATAGDTAKKIVTWLNTFTA